ncbi:hypothetical protein C4Y57_009290, partial [Klebsiella variicola]
EWVHVQLHQQKGMISLSPPTICNSALQFSSPGNHSLSPFTGVQREFYLEKHYPGKYAQTAPALP